jgi:hypothetical protein
MCALLASAVAAADTFYRYRDKATGRDVFVSSLEQVPRQYRDQTKIVLESGGPPNQDDAREEAPSAPADDGIAEKLMRQLAPAASSVGIAVRHAPPSKNPLVRGPAIAIAAVDAKLGKAGAHSLAAEERAQLSGLLRTAIWAGTVAALCSFVVWFTLIVCAFRDRHPVWGALMILLWPLAVVYLALRFDTSRPLLKAACWLGLLSPALVGLVTAWRFHAWFQAVVQARGGRL